jgi:phosphinothricin acetyltransferase
MIRKILYKDRLRVLEIYKMGIETGNATFETKVPTWKQWNSNHLTHSRLVYESNRKILGWAALSPVSDRVVYKGVAEISIYVDVNFLGQKIGFKLMNELIKSSEKYGIWTLTSSVFPENQATFKLHKNAGFRIVGVREKIASHYGNWRNTLIFERRSQKKF